MNNNKIYITTPIYYANGSPHIGHFLTTTVADVVARYYRQKLGPENVYFTTGLDEHGTTVEQAAVKDGYTSDNFQAYVDKRSVEWKEAFDATNISYDYFVRTTAQQHKEFAQEFIKKMVNAGDVYKSTYKGKYCNGCEKFLTLSDLDEHGLCQLHRPDQVIETVEDNYFFKLSKYASNIKDLIEKDEIKIIPDNKKNDMLARLESGVEDISISRPKEKVAWGVEFPDDSNQTVYVWVEALINYLSNLEVNKRQDLWEGAYHFLAKDINWFHNVIWPSFLLSAGYTLYKGSFVHGFLTVGGQKISKSLGNIITPNDLVNRYGTDGARYVILSNFPYKNDSDVTWEALDEKYTADLANGLGNTVARLAKLAENSGFAFVAGQNIWQIDIVDFRIDLAVQEIWKKLADLDGHINENEPWAIKDEQKLKEVLFYELNELRQVTYAITPFIPETAKKIQDQFKGPKIKSQTGLFPRLS